MFDLQKNQKLDLQMFSFLATPANMVMPKVPQQLHFVFGYTEEDGIRQIQTHSRGMPTNLELAAKTPIVDLINMIGTYVDLSKFNVGKSNQLEMHHKIINGMIASADTLTSNPLERDILLKALVQIDSLLTDNDAQPKTGEVEPTTPEVSGPDTVAT